MYQCYNTLYLWQRSHLLFFVQEHALAQAELLKRQEKLERKAAELDRREREMQNLSQHGSIQRSLKWK